MPLPHIHKYAAELLATFTLTLAVSLSLLFVFPLSTPVIAALVVGLFVYTIGSISGAHINPAVTVGMWTIKKIETKEALAYIVAQVLGAGIATICVLALADTNPPLAANESFAVLLAEAVGAFFLTFGVASVATGKVDDEASGLVVGGSLLLGIIIASTTSNGILNPAVAFGLGALSPAYLVGPLLGGAAGAYAYSWLVSKR